MPFYDYECSSCGCEVEVLQPSGASFLECFVCSTPMVRRFPVPAMIKIKGEGGYPSRRKQIRNTTKKNHPKLEREPNRVYFSK